MLLPQHLFGIPSPRQTYRDMEVNIVCRWFLSYNLLDNIPHFATVSYAVYKHFSPELVAELFENILNKTKNNKMVDLSAVFIDGTHIKACANKKKFQKEVAKTAEIYEGSYAPRKTPSARSWAKSPLITAAITTKISDNRLLKLSKRRCRLPNRTAE